MSNNQKRNFLTTKEAENKAIEVFFKKKKKHGKFKCERCDSIYTRRICSVTKDAKCSSCTATNRQIGVIRIKPLKKDDFGAKLISESKTRKKNRFAIF